MVLVVRRAKFGNDYYHIAYIANERCSDSSNLFLQQHGKSIMRDLSEELYEDGDAYLLRVENEERHSYRFSLCERIFLWTVCRRRLRGALCAAQVHMPRALRPGCEFGT